MTQAAFLGGEPAVTEAWEQDWPILGEEEQRIVGQLLSEGILSIYDRSGIIADFEDAFSEWVSPPGQPILALSHNSGTSSLHAAYFGLGLGPGDEVIVPTYTFLATVTPLLACGATPVFTDMDPDTLTLSPEDAACRITSRTKALVVTHMWGHPANMAAIIELAEKHGLPVVEDCSHAHGATIEGRQVGTFGAVGCFSLEGHKAIAAGEGGMLVTSRREVYERAILLGHFGRRAKDEITDPQLRPFVSTGFGHKYRMHPLAAGVALAQLGRVDELIERRRGNLELLSEQLKDVPGIAPPITQRAMTRGGWYGYKPRFVPGDVPGLTIANYIDVLSAEGVKVKRPGSPPLHQLPVFDLSAASARALDLPWAASLPSTKRARISLPVAETIYPLLLSLPTFSGDCARVIEQYGNAFRKVAENRIELREHFSG